MGASSPAGGRAGAVTMRDVAERAGVSPATVSRVLSGDPLLRVGDQTRARVLSAARHLQYLPSHAGRSLRTARTSAIAVIVPDVTSAVFAELTAGATAAAAARGHTVVLARAEELTADSGWIDRLLGEGRVDGAVLQIPDGAPSEVVDSLARHGRPVVVINSLDDGPVDTIILDDAAGIDVAVEHLVALGHRRIGFVGGSGSSATGARRRQAFVDSMRRCHLPVPGDETPSAWITSRGYSGADGRTAAEELLSSPTLPTALVVANLNAALGVLAQIHRSHLRVPDDVSLVALHDVWYADALWPPLTTVRMPLRELGYAAVERLLAVREADPVHEVIDTPPVLVVRESSSAPSNR